MPEELETVKAVIRALLIAENRPMSLRSFLIAFKDREGHEVPYRNFGFSDALSFLRYIPDAVQLSQLGRDFSVTATVTDEVKHVERLVKCQRESNYLSRPSPPSSKRAALRQLVQSTLYWLPRQRYLLALSYNDALEQVRANLRLLLADFLTNGISVRLLQEIYTRRFGHFINYTGFGYSTFEDFLVGMSDIMWAARNSTGAVKLYPRRSVGAPSYLLPSEKPVSNFTVRHKTVMRSVPRKRVQGPMQQVTRTAHRGLHLQESVPAIQSLYSDMQSTGMKPQQEPYQRSPAVQSLRQDIQRTGAVPKMWASNQSRSSSLYLDIQPAGMKPLIPESCPTVPKESSVHPDTKPGVEKAATRTSFQRGLISLPKRSLEDYKESGTDTGTLIQQEMTTRRSTEHHGSSCYMNLRLEKNIKIILRQHPKGIWLSQFANIYKAMTGVDLCPADRGHNYLLDLMLGYRHVVSLTRPFPDQDFVVSLHENLRDSPLDQGALDAMHTLIRFSGQQGMTVEELLQSFERITGNSIDLEEHGLSHRAFALMLVTKFNVMYETLRNGQVLMKCKELHWGRANATSSVETARPAEASEAASENQTAQVTERASLTSTLREMSGLRSPLLFIRNNPYKQPDHLEVGKYYRVHVSEIYSIYHFYIQVRATDASVRLKALMIQLDKMYNGPKSSAYIIDLVYLGMPCAAYCPYNEGRSHWYRALIVAFDTDPNTCQVFLVDYGTLAFLKKRDLRYLRKEFMELPPQALRAIIDLLRPVNSANWTPDTNAAFRMLASKNQTFTCRVLKRLGTMHSVSLCITSPHSEVYLSDLLVNQGLALPNSQFNEIMAKILEAESFFILQQVDVPSPPPSAKSGGGTTSIPIPMPYTQKLVSQVMEAGPSSTAQQENFPCATPSMNVRTTLRHPPANPILRSQDCRPVDQAEPCSQNIPSVSRTIELAQSLIKLRSAASTTEPCADNLRHPPANPILRSQDCQPVDQAEPCSQNIPSISQTTELAQSLVKLCSAAPTTEPCSQNIPSVSQTIELAQSVKLCSAAPTTDHAQQMQAVSFTPSVQLTSLPHAHDVRAPTLQYPKEIPHEFVTPHQLNETCYPSLFNVCEDRRISHPKKFQNRLEEQRSAELCASSAVQPCAASTTQTVVQSPLHTSIYSIGEQASKPLHCPEQTVAASAVQEFSLPGREASVQATVSSPAQPQFSIQLTSKPTKVFPVIPHTQSVKPKMATNNWRPSQSVGEPAVSSALQLKFQTSVQRTTKTTTVFPVMPRAQNLKPKMAENTTSWRPSQSDGKPTVSSAPQPHFQASVQRATMPAPVFLVMPHAQTQKPKMPESTTIRRYSQSGGEPAVSSALQPEFRASVQLALKPTKDFPVIPPPPIEKPEMTGCATNQPACGAVDDDKGTLDLLQQELDGPCPVRAVKLEWLMPGVCLMVVNYQGEPYVTSANVCQLLGWSADVVLKRLEAKRIQFPTLVLRRNRRNCLLFNQMASFNVPGVKICNHLVQKVTFFPLESVTDLLNLFGCTTMELKQAIAEVLDAFDPKSPYWHVLDDHLTRR